ncbi:MAG: ATPase [Candidatus Aminicenantes bacterium RBG_13_62_12]|nr:MAG: ATPase [Candidatus Aminicenantes bacterium RBG_13_62_12]
MDTIGKARVGRGRTSGLFAGIDIGASMTKAVLLDDRRNAVGTSVVRSGMDFRLAARKALRLSEKDAGLTAPRFEGITATGYGRHNAPFAATAITEISCHARGSYHHFPRAHTLVDIGGQDSKVVKIDAEGRRTDFKLNRKCAAGTGAFLEEIAHRLRLSLGRFDGLARKSRKEIELGSYCTVFAVTEILARIRQNTAVPDIIKAAYSSVIKRILEMDPLEGDLVLSGGIVAHHPYFVTMFETVIGRRVFVPPLPQLTGAWGAALYAQELRRGPDA